jgi:hypothetical protein
MKKHFLSLAILAMVSITVYGQELRRTEPILVNSPGFTMNEGVEILATTGGRYHMLDLRKIDLVKGVNLNKVKIKAAPGDPVFRNKLASDENLHEFIFVSKDPAQQKLILLLPKSMILAGAYTEKLPAIVPRIPAGDPEAFSKTKIYDRSTPVEAIPATKVRE